MAWNPFDYRSPWEPAPIRTTARTYAQWALSAMGAGADWITNKLTQLFDLSRGQAGIIAQNAVNFQDRLDSLNNGDKNGKIPRGRIPRNANLPEAYRAVATACFENEATGDKQYITFIADFDHNPTLQEIIDAGPPIFSVLSSRGSPRVVESQRMKPCGTTVNSLERRT